MSRTKEKKMKNDWDSKRKLERTSSGKHEAKNVILYTSLGKNRNQQ